MSGEIVQKENKILRKVSKEVPIENIRSRKVETIIRRMIKALNSQDDGVAIAAPQIGENLRIFIVSKKIFEISKEKITVDEGCLSVRWLYGKVKRSKKTLIKAYDENGKSFTLGGSGLLSQAFQHETDHLNGILFTDKASNLKEVPPTKEKLK